MKIENIKTDNIPLLDELIYNLKKLVLSSVIKDESKALKYETLESMKDANRYIACVEGNARFEIFEYSRKLIEKSSIPDYLIDECVRDKYKIPMEKRNEVLKMVVEETLNSYEETNHYYRTLYGVPELGKEGIKITDSYLPEEVSGIDVSKYLHEMDVQTIDLLYSVGVLDKIISENPEEKYLNYMGSRSIHPYTARKATNFSLLYTTNTAATIVTNKFKEKYETNRVYTLKTVYNEAFKLGSEYYDNFIQVFIIIQTMVDMIAEIPDMIIKREIFDIRMIELLFKSHGVDFFPEIPFKYQLAMVKNINKLIKYKSTTVNIVDICSLFGFNNVEVFKYYLLKERKMDKEGNYIFEYKEDEDGNLVEDNSKNYDLKFLKVPIDDIPDNYLNNGSSYLDYDEIISGDKYWNGDLPHDYVKSSILEKEFNYIQSKYLSVDSIYSLTELSFQLIYFHNMIFDNHIVEEMLTMKIPSINSLRNFRFVDIFCFLYALMYEYNNIEDDIMDTQSKIMQIKGFNFKADMEYLGNYVKEKGYTLEELGVADFQIPNSQILSYNQLMYIFTKNKQIHDHLVKQISIADNKKIYDIYYKLYDSLMLSELTKDFFTKSDGTMATSYTDFIKDRDKILYTKLLDIRAVESVDQKRFEINELINDIVYIIEQYMESDDYKFIFSYMPSISAEAIKQYVYKVINFFKSYKVDFQSINTIYKFDDKLDNKIKMIDNVLFKYIYTKVTTIEALSKLHNTSVLTKEERMKLIDEIYIDITYWLDLLFNEDKIVSDKLMDKLLYMTKIEHSEIVDRFDSLTTILEKSVIVEIMETIKFLSDFTREEKIQLIDEIYMSITYWLDLYFSEDKIIQDYLASKISYISKKDDNGITDRLNHLDTTLEKSVLIQIIPIANLISKLDRKDKLELIDDVYIDITYWLDLFFGEDEITKDCLISKLLHVNKEEYMNIYDTITINTVS